MRLASIVLVASHDINIHVIVNNLTGCEYTYLVERCWRFLVCLLVTSVGLVHLHHCCWFATMTGETGSELVRRAFVAPAEQEVDEEFSKEKAEAEDRDDPARKKEIAPNTVTGWCSWTGQGAPPPRPPRSYQSIFDLQKRSCRSGRGWTRRNQTSSSTRRE